MSGIPSTIEGVTIAIPIKRGLKVCLTALLSCASEVTIAIPIKRGLKVQLPTSHAETFIAICVTIAIPIKRGLKAQPKVINTWRS